MKNLMIFTLGLLTLVSCSGIVTRSPSSADLSCSESVKGFFKEQNGVISSTDKAVFAGDKTISAFLSVQKTEREEVERALILVKKKYRHMDSSQVIGHFKLLRNSCERS